MDDEGRAGLLDLGQPAGGGLAREVRLQNRPHAKPGRGHRRKLPLLACWRRPKQTGARRGGGKGGEGRVGGGGAGVIFMRRGGEGG